MKKYVMLIAFTLVSALLIVESGEMWRKSFKVVDTVKVATITAQSSISCSGKVEHSSVKDLYAPVSSIIDQVYVKPGDHVTAGKALFKATTVESDSSEEYSQQQVEQAYASILHGGLPSSTIQQQKSALTAKVITAPTSGEVTAVSAVAQTAADPTKPAVTIIGNDGLQVRLSVNESQISNIKVGQQAQITGVGFKNSIYQGKVKNISSEAKQIISANGQETVVEVVVSVKNPGTDIKPGYTAKARIVTAQKDDVLIAPYEAVRADLDGSEYVYRIYGNRAIKTPVTTSIEYESGFEISSGLSRNDRIITNPDMVSNNAHVITSSQEKGGS